VFFDDLIITHTKGKVLQEDHYYPFGLSINALSSTAPLSKPNHFKIQGKEQQTEFDINLYDFGARNYDPQIGRWLNPDPLADQLYNLSPYNYVENNPLRFIDPDGMLSTEVEENEDGTYTVVGGDANDGDKNIYVVEQGERTRSIGESVTSHSFFDDGENAVVGAIIDPNSTEGQNFVDDEIIEGDPSLLEYLPNAIGGKKFDLKDRDIKKRPEGTTELQYRYRGSKSGDGKFGSARDFGNIGAGIVAGRKGLTWEGARFGFDTLESFQKLSITGEKTTTKKAQWVGYQIGRIMSLIGK
jgi:RHS repeat-associated protein